jgi:hypothetical protein
VNDLPTISRPSRTKRAAFFIPSGMVDGRQVVYGLHSASKIPRRVATVEWSSLSNQASRWDAEIICHRIQAVNDLPTVSRPYRTKRAAFFIPSGMVDGRQIVYGLHSASKIPRRVATVEWSSLSNQASRWDADIIRLAHRP